MLHAIPQGSALPTGIRAVIYDIDNCLAPLSNDDITSAWDVFFAETFNLPLEEAISLRKHYYETDGCSARGYFNAMKDKFNLPPTWANDVYADTGASSGERFIKRHTPSNTLSTHVGRLHGLGIKQIAITQGHPHHYRPILSHMGIAKFLEHCIDRTHAVHEKLEPEVWHIALGVLKVPAHQVVVLEDTPRNLVQPHNLGMHTILIGNRDPGPNRSSIHHRFDTAEQFLELLAA